MSISLTRISHVSIFLLLITVLKSILSVAVRSSVMAFFGVSDATDAYFAAFVVPQQLSDFFVGGIMFLTIIPVFQKRVSEVGEADASEEMSSFLNFFVLAMAVISVLYFVFSPYLMPIIFSGFQGEKLSMTIKFSRLFSPAILLMALSLVYVSIYHSFSDFFLPSLASLSFPLSSLASLWLLPSSLGIERLIYGNLIGAAVSLLMLVALIKNSFKWDFSRWEIGNPIVKGVMLLSWPLLLDAIFGRIYPLVQRNVASGLPLEGAVTVLEISLFVTGSVSLFITGPISTAIFPLMGRQRLENDGNALFQTLQKSLQIAIFLILPVNIILLMESKDIVDILFSYGKFTPEAAKTTALMLSILSLTILPNLLSSMFSRVLFIFHETKLFCISSTIIGLLTLPLYFIIGRFLGILGVASVISLVSALVAINAWFILRLRHSNASSSISLGFCVRVLVCVAGLLIIVLAIRIFLSEHIASALIRLSLISTFGLAVYVLAAYILGVEELRRLIDGTPILKGLLRI